jgi:CheY-like chemotaxis protein
VTGNRKKSILIVEDDPELAEVYHTLLSQVGYKVLVAHNGEDALRVTADEQPKLILLDLRMPVMDGVEFLEKYKLKEKHPDVKVVIFTCRTKSMMRTAWARNAMFSKPGLPLKSYFKS